MFFRVFMLSTSFLCNFLFVFSFVLVSIFFGECACFWQNARTNYDFLFSFLPSELFFVVWSQFMFFRNFDILASKIDWFYVCCYCHSINTLPYYFLTSISLYDSILIGFLNDGYPFRSWIFFRWLFRHWSMAYFCIMRV